MSIEAEVKIVKRQNRRLKVALFTSLAVVLASVVAGTVLTTLMASRYERGLDERGRGQFESTPTIPEMGV